MQVQEIPISEILIDDDFNCRGAMAPIDVADLAKDIEANGLTQPVVVMLHNDAEKAATGKTYKLIAGFRRTYAHKILRRESIFASVMHHLSPQEALLKNLGENLKRKDLNIVQEAKVVDRLSRLGMIQEDIALQCGMSRGWVLARLALLKLPEDVQKEAAAGLITQYQIKALAAIAHKPDQMYAAVRKIKEAKAKCEDPELVLPTRKKPKPYERKVRKPHEIEEMINTIMDQVGGSVVTRTLAWAAGNISDLELYEEVRKVSPDFTNPVYTD